MAELSQDMRCLNLTGFALVEKLDHGKHGFIRFWVDKSNGKKGIRSVVGEPIGKNRDTLLIRTWATIQTRKRYIQLAFETTYIDSFGIK